MQILSTEQILFLLQANMVASGANSDCVTNQWKTSMLKNIFFPGRLRIEMVYQERIEDTLVVKSLLLWTFESCWRIGKISFVFKYIKNKPTI